MDQQHHTAADNSGNVASVVAVANFGGTFTMTNSTIAGNSASGYRRGRLRNRASTTAAISFHPHPGAYADLGQRRPRRARGFQRPGLMAPSLADTHNLFGVDGTAGVEGFSPGPTDIVPPTGVQLADILNPTLAFNGGLDRDPRLGSGQPGH